MKKTLKRILVCLMCIVMLQTAFIPTKIQAAAVKLNKTSVTLATGKNYTLKLQGTKQKPTWKSSNTRIASVSSGGKVTARRTGEATITAKVGKKNYKCNVTVTPDYNQIYYKYLASHHKDIRWYYILNVDKTGAPETITTSSGGGTTSYNVYTISGSKVVLAGSYGAKGISMSPPTISYVSKYKCLYADGWTNFIGGTWANMYGMSAKKLVLKYHAREAHSRGDSYYYGRTDSSAKRVSKAAYIRYYNTYFKNHKTYKMKANNK